MSIGRVNEQMSIECKTDRLRVCIINVFSNRMMATSTTGCSCPLGGKALQTDNSCTVLLELTNFGEDPPPKRRSHLETKKDAFQAELTFPLRFQSQFKRCVGGTCGGC